MAGFWAVSGLLLVLRRSPILLLSGGFALVTTATSIEKRYSWLQPAFSFACELSTCVFSRLHVKQPTEDQFSITRKVFYTGVLHGLRGQIIQPEGALSLAGEKQLVGAFMEGEALGLVISDQLIPWKSSNWRKLCSTNSYTHPYEMHTGLGMGIGLLEGDIESLLISKELDLFWQWFAIDGLGFQQTLCNPNRYLTHQVMPDFQRLSAYACRVFDQGLGRSLWFQFNGDIQKIADAVNSFPAHRQADLWTGTGVAAAHTGGTSTQDLSQLGTASGNYRKNLAAGVAVAAHVRSLAGAKACATEEACYILTGLSAEQCAAIVRQAHDIISQDHSYNSHEVWQNHIISHLAESRESK